MTRKDYIKIANTLIDSMQNIINDESISLEDIAFIKNELTTQFCKTLKCDNNSFNEEIFLSYIDNNIGSL